MARYKLMFYPDGRNVSNIGLEKEVEGCRKSTRAEIETWFNEMVEQKGLDWRAGGMIKFRDGPEVYVWRWIKDDAELSY